MNDEIHSCSYYCQRPSCIKAQRDELVRKYVESQDKAEPVAVVFEAIENVDSREADLSPPRYAVKGRINGEYYGFDCGYHEGGKRRAEWLAETLNKAISTASPTERVRVPDKVRAALEWYASDPSVWVSFAPGDYEKQFNEANESPYLNRIGDDRRGHPQFVPNEVRAEEALRAWDEAIASAEGDSL